MNPVRKISRTTLVLFAALVSIVLVACSDSDSPTDVPADVTGTYLLVTVNGLPLPILAFEDDEIIEEVTALSLTLSAGGACSSSITLRVTEKATGATETLTETEACTFSVAGNTLTLTFAPDDVETGTISGTTITLVLEGGAFVLVLEKQ